MYSAPDQQPQEPQEPQSPPSGGARRNQIDESDKNLPEFMRSDPSACEHVRQRYNTMYQYKLQYTRRNNVHYELYRGHSKPVTYPHQTTLRSNIHVPYSFATVEQIVPRIVKGCLNDGFNFFDLLPRESTDLKKATQHKKLIKWQLERINFYFEFAMMVKTASIFGYCAAKVDWLFQVGPKHRLKVKDKYANEIIDYEMRKKYGHAMYEEVVEENEILHDSNRFQCLDWDEAYIDETAKYTLHNGRDFIHATRRTLRQLREMKRPDGQDLYYNLDKIDLKDSYSQEDSDRDRRMAAAGLSRDVWRQQGHRNDLDRDSTEVMILEYWTRDYVVTVANNVTIRRSFNHFFHGQIPAVDLNYTYVPNELFGIGAIESFRDLQVALNEITNLDINNWSMSVNQMFAVDKRANISQRQLISRPWGVIYSDMPPNQAIMPIQKQSIAGETAAKQQELRANIMLASGLTDIHYMGTSSGSRVGRTATGLMQAMEETNFRTEMQVALSEFMTLRPTLKMFASNNLQFMRTPKWVQVVGERAARKDPELINPEDIWEETDIILYGGRRMQKRSFEQHQFTQFLGVVGRMPQIMAQYKPRKLATEALRRYISDDTEDFMVPLPSEVMTPHEENTLMMYGQEVEPTMEEDFQAHLEAHYMFVHHPSFQTLPLDVQYCFEKHIQETLKIVDMLRPGPSAGGAASGMPQGGVGHPIEEGDVSLSEGSQLRESQGMGNNPTGDFEL